MTLCYVNADNTQYSVVVQCDLNKACLCLCVCLETLDVPVCIWTVVRLPAALSDIVSSAYFMLQLCSLWFPGHESWWFVTLCVVHMWYNVLILLERGIHRNYYLTIDSKFTTQYGNIALINRNKHVYISHAIIETICKKNWDSQLRKLVVQ